MKQFSAFFLAIVLLFTALFVFSSCGSKEYEIISGTYGGTEIVVCISINPFSVDSGEISACKMITYADKKISTIEPCYVASSMQSADFKDDKNQGEDGEYLCIVSAFEKRVLYNYNFEANCWESTYEEKNLDDMTFVK